MTLASPRRDHRRSRFTVHGSRLLAALLLAALSTLATAAPRTTLPPPVARALARAGIPQAAVGVYVHEIERDRTLIAHRADRPLDPASTMKLVTTYAALDLLGPAYSWKTEAYAEGPLHDGVLAGNLVLKGYGDPALTLQQFWLLLRSIRARGVRDVRGDLVLDRSYFAAPAYDAARFDDRPMRPYNTGPNALLVNFKAVTVHFIPDPQARTVRLDVEPTLGPVHVVNRLVLIGGRCGYWAGRLRMNAQNEANAARIVLSGDYPLGCGEQERSFSVLSDTAYVGALFRRLWHELGGTLSGAVRAGTANAAAQLLVTHQSPPLALVVRDMDKYSNNVMARQLFLTLAADQYGAPATVANGRRAVESWLGRQGLASPGLAVENGSGLSRRARVSARTLGRLLVNAYRSPVMPEFMSSLPIAAVDGTMRKRLRDTRVAGRAHVKTGSLDGVRAIAGYVLDAHGRRDVVVFIVNHAHARAAQPAEDALLEWVYRRGR